jgi:hypothetical protein
MSGYGEGNFGEGPYGGNQPEGFDFSAFEYRIRNWAETASPEFRSAFASDCAARTLPNIFGATLRSIDPQLPIFSFDLTLMRSIISARVRATHASIQVKKSNAAAGLAAKAAYAKVIAKSENSTPVALSTDAAAYCADAANSAYSSASAAFTNNTTTALCAESSIARLDNGGLERLFPISLWLGFPSPEIIETNWSNLKAEWSTDPAMTFWIDWYDGLLAGRAPDRDLWHDIVLIDDEHWQAGPEAVAREIEILQAARDVDENIERFEAQLLQLASEPIFRGNRDNGGPPIEDHQARLATIQLIQAQLDVLKAEAEKAKPNSEEDPDPEVILTAIEKLKELVKKHFIIATVATTIGTTCVVNIVDSGFERYHVSEAFYETFEAIPSAATKLLEKLAQRPSSKPTTSKPRVDSTPIDI